MLSAAYERCCACFVGGSLAPLGGQNFLEPVAHGVLPVIGPHWENFAWVGREIVNRGLVRVASDWRLAAEMLTAVIETPPQRQTQRRAAMAYLSARCGGAAHACREIERLLGEKEASGRGAS
jgi:3-deoxy-D-manno-octulosonic-acid transferase